MRAVSFLSVVILSVVVLGCVCDTDVTSGEEELRNGRMVRKIRRSEVRPHRDTRPSEEALADMAKLSDLDVLNFYTALKGLYVSGGFEKGNELNSAILGQSNIPSVIWKSVRNAVKRTQWEIKNGDVSMRRLEATMALFSADTLLREPWLSSLAVEIAKRSTEAKNLAFAIRDIGEHLERQHVTRVDYTNGTFLRELISSWLTDQKLEFDEDLVSLLITIHHSIGPDHFDSLADVLEVIPYQVDGMFVMDAESLIYHSDHVEKEVRDADVGLKLTVALRNAFRNLTGTNASTTAHDFLYQLSIADIDKGTTIKLIDEVMKKALGNAEDGMDRLARCRKRWNDLFGREGMGEETIRFASMCSHGFSSNVSIGSIENVRQTMLGGARLIHNLDSIQSVIFVISDVPLVAEHLREKGEVTWEQRADAVLNIIKFLPEIRNGKTAGEHLLKAFLKESKLETRAFLPVFARSDKKLLITMFENLKEIDQSVVEQVATTIRWWTAESLEQKLGDVTRAGVLEIMRTVFGAKDLKTKAEAQTLDKFLMSLLDLAQGKSDLLSSTRELLLALSTQLADYSGFISSMTEVLSMSRDEHFRDVRDAVRQIEVVLSPDSHNEVGASFSAILSRVSSEVEHSLREVLLALKQLMAHESMAGILLDYIQKGAFEHFVAAKQFGLDAELISSRVTATMFVDDVLEVLEAAGSREGLGRLLEFHSEHTTAHGYPNASLELINSMIDALS